MCVCVGVSVSCSHCRAAEQIVQECSCGNCENWAWKTATITRSTNESKNNTAKRTSSTSHALMRCKFIQFRTPEPMSMPSFNKHQKLVGRAQPPRSCEPFVLNICTHIYTYTHQYICVLHMYCWKPARSPFTSPYEISTVEGDGSLQKCVNMRVCVCVCAYVKVPAFG